MSERKALGKITAARFGWGGYQDCMFGLTLMFETDGGGVGHFDGTWGIERAEYAKWTEEDRVKLLGETCVRLRDTLKDAKKMCVEELMGVPVEVTFEGNMLKKWRILTEVL